MYKILPFGDTCEANRQGPPWLWAWDWALNFHEKELVIFRLSENIQVRDSAKSLYIKYEDFMILKNYKDLSYSHPA